MFGERRQLWFLRIEGKQVFEIIIAQHVALEWKEESLSAVEFVLILLMLHQGSVSHQTGIDNRIPQVKWVVFVVVGYQEEVYVLFDIVSKDGDEQTVDVGFQGP